MIPGYGTSIGPVGTKQSGSEAEEAVALRVPCPARQLGVGGVIVKLQPDRDARRFKLLEPAVPLVEDPGIQRPQLQAE